MSNSGTCQPLKFSWEEAKPPGSKPHISYDAKIGHIEMTTERRMKAGCSEHCDDKRKTDITNQNQHGCKLNTEKQK